MLLLQLQLPFQFLRRNNLNSSLRVLIQDHNYKSDSHEQEEEEDDDAEESKRLNFVFQNFTW